MDENLDKALDETLEELEKAFKTGKKPEGGDTQPKPKDGDTQTKPEGADTQSTVPPVNAEEDSYEVPEKKTEEDNTSKSIYDEVREEAGDYLDVSDFLNTLTKSISKRIDEIHEDVKKSLHGQAVIAKSLSATAQVMKSIGDEPMPRKSVLNKSERQFGDEKQDPEMSRNEILAKAQKAVEQGKIPFVKAGVIEDRLNKGVPLDENTLSLLKSIN
jgi:hypothetical protein